MCGEHDVWKGRASSFFVFEWTRSGRYCSDWEDEIFRLYRWVCQPS